MSKYTQCPYIVGDSHQRDCEFPDCSGGWEEVYKDAIKEITRLRDDLNQAYKFIAYNSESFGGDWACERCHQNSEILIDGFVCAYHKAKDFMDAKCQLIY